MRPVEPRILVAKLAPPREFETGAGVGLENADIVSVGVVLRS